jgi:hypothetical protein
MRWATNACLLSRDQGEQTAADPVEEKEFQSIAPSVRPSGRSEPRLGRDEIETTMSGNRKHSTTRKSLTALV